MMRLSSLSSGVSGTALAAPKAARSASVSRVPSAGGRVTRQVQLRPQCMQAGAGPGPGPGMAGRQAPVGAQERTMAPAPLARRPAPYAAAPQQAIYLELSQVIGKQVITRTSGRALGVASAAWLDPARCQLVSLDLDERRALSSTRIGNIPLSALRQIGDVVLVHDESALYEQDLDGRMGFVNPLGLEVRTRSGEFLGKVRDVSFSPDNGEVARLVYDEFGLPSLPLQFFDCYSVSAADILSLGRGQVIVFDDAKYRERKESNGVFAAIPTLLKSLSVGRSTPQLALPPASTTDAYRLGSGASSSGGAGYLPADYSYEQWQQDLRQWEQETGMTYEQYLRSQQSRPQATPRAALPPAGRTPTAGGYAYGASPYQQPQQQQQQQRAPQQQQYAPQRADYGQYAPPQTAAPAAGDGRYRALAQQQPQQQPGGRYGPAGQPIGPASARPGWGAAPAADPRQRSGTAAPGPTYAPQQPQQQPSSFGQRAQPPYQQQQARPPMQQQSQAQPLQQPQQQQQQQPPQQQQAQAAPRAWEGTASSSNGGEAGGRPLNEWIDRDSRPRMAEVLGDGLLPQADAAASQRGGPMRGRDSSSGSNGNGGSTARGGGWDGAGAPAPAAPQQYGGGVPAAESAEAGSGGAASWPS